jgi:tetratricopeptide (TPR) repeat protein
MKSGFQWQFENAEQFFSEALEIYQKLSFRQDFVAAYGTMGSHLVWQGRFHEARSLEYKILVTHPDLEYTQNWAAFIHAIAGFPDQYLGAYEAARSQAQHALRLIRKVKHHEAAQWAAMNIDILGRIALAEGSYSEAEKSFLECMPIYHDYDYPDNIGQALACMGLTARGLNQISQAKGHLYGALRIAIEAESYLSLMQTLPGIALLFADRGGG